MLVIRGLGAGAPAGPESGRRAPPPTAPRRWGNRPRSTRPGPLRLHRECLAPRVLQRHVGRIAVGELRDVDRPHLELDPDLLEDRRPLRRARGEDQRSPKNRATSRAADSFESEPWTMFWPTSRAKSPRMDPGAASSGSVA